MIIIMMTMMIMVLLSQVSVGHDLYHSIAVYDWANRTVVAKSRSVEKKTLAIDFTLDDAGLVQAGMHFVRSAVIIIIIIIIVIIIIIITITPSSSSASSPYSSSSSSAAAAASSSCSWSDSCQVLEHPGLEPDVPEPGDRPVEPQELQHQAGLHVHRLVRHPRGHRHVLR
jgi:hypothetical protein